MSGATLHAKTSITIDAGTLIGRNTKILDHDFHPVDWCSRNPDNGSKVKTAPIVIVKNVLSAEIRLFYAALLWGIIVLSAQARLSGAEIIPQVV